MLVIVFSRKVLGGCGLIPRSSVLGRWVWTHSQVLGTGRWVWSHFQVLGTGEVGVVSFPGLRYWGGGRGLIFFVVDLS